MSKSRNNKKTSQSLESQTKKFAEYFNALSHPHRLRIFLKLATQCKGKVCKTDVDVKSCVSDVGKGLNIAPSTLSHHVKELKRVGLIHVERNGQSIGCWVETRTLKEIETFFSDIQSCK